MEKDWTTACKWFETAAKAGHVPAMLCLGEAYLNGSGVDENRVRGLFYILNAVKHGNRDAIALLGICYLNGDRLPQRDDLAAKWLTVGSNRGCTRSMMALAFYYRRGIGEGKSIVKACAYLAVAMTKSGIRSAINSSPKLTDQLTEDQKAEVKRLIAKILNGGKFEL